MHRTDRKVGIGIALLAIAVLWTARGFPDVPGQKLGASSLPLLVGAGLLVCGILLALRGGHHCNQPLMRKLGLASTTRASFYLYNTEEEVERMVASLRRVLKFFGAA